MNMYLPLIAAIAVLSIGGAQAQTKTPAEQCKYIKEDEARKHCEFLMGRVQAPSKDAPGDACKLLTDAEVRRVFADARPGKRETQLEQYGVASCTWDHRGGRFAVQAMKGSAKIDSEIRSRADGLLDPLKRRGKDPMRYVAVKDVGDAALAFVEPADEKRGILHGGAVLITKRGDKQIILMSDQLQDRERDAALKALEELGRAAA